MVRSLTTSVVVLFIVAGCGLESVVWADGGMQSGSSCRWEAGFWSRDLDGEPFALEVFDDGTGPAIFATGLIRHANGQFVDGFARWDGAGWSRIDDPSGAWGNGYGFAYALAVFDDGSGAALYAGGYSFYQDGTSRAIVARWDGFAWHELGLLASPTSMYPEVRALAVFDDGSGPALFASGHFETADGLVVNNIAKWDGSSWGPLAGSSGIGLESGARDLTVFDDGSGAKLYAGGHFSTAGGVAVNSIARWDGAEWSVLSGPSGEGVDGTVYALEVFDDGTGAALYVAGTFNLAGGIFSLQIAKWDGGVWSALTGPSGTGIIGGWSYVYSLEVYDDGTGARLYAGGEFSTAGGIATPNVASWDGTRWWALDGPLGNGTSETVNALVSYDDGNGAKLYAGGDFDLAGGASVGKIASWDGTAWAPLSATTGNGIGSSAHALETIESNGGLQLVAAGYFQSAGAIPASRIAVWDGAAWAALDGPTGNGIDGYLTTRVSDLQTFDDGSGQALYAGGVYRSAGGLAVNDNIARYKNAQWELLSGSSPALSGGAIDSLAVFDDGAGPALYAGGRFTEIGGTPAQRIAQWDGMGWSPLVGPVGEGANDRVDALTVFNDGSGPALYAGGLFSSAGGVAANRIAKWDGSEWSALIGPSGNGTDGWVYDLAVFDDGGGEDLYVGGCFETAGGVTVNGIARWDGNDWSTVSGPQGYGVDGICVISIVAWDDGQGPALYVGGGFSSAGGIDASNIARWDGSTWSSLDGPEGNGVDLSVWDLHPFDHGPGSALAVAGSFRSAGGIASDRIAIWRCDEDLLFADGFEDGTTCAWSEDYP